MRKKRRQVEVELNLAAMLDMAFQLLTFFILTFRPAPVEGQVLLRMPLPQPISGTASGQPAGTDANNPNPLAALNTLVISALASESGSLRQLAIGDMPLGSSLAALDRRLAAVLGSEGSAFDQVIIQVDSRLRYEELMRVVDVCTRQKLPDGRPLTKLSFVEGA
jgi:biopolymer transport protein ExbD